MKNAKIVINTNTWSRDTYELFDYECLTTLSQNYYTSSSCNLIRLGNNIEFLDMPPESESDVLATISKDFSNYWIQKSKSDLWLVVKSLDQGYDIEENDIIKFGRVKLRVKFLKTNNSEYLTNTNTTKPEDSCRICLSDENHKDNPLISPCSCTGSMKFIHLDCLKTWFNSKIQKALNQNSICYFWKNIDCEVCKKPFEHYMGLLEIGALGDKELKENSCMILESVEKDKGNSRGLHLIRFTDDETLKIGRGHESQIKLFDISVSRFHASIEYCRGKVVLRDNHSKFGTLVEVLDKYEVFEDVVMQSGRTTVALKLDYSGGSSTSED